MKNVNIALVEDELSNCKQLSSFLTKYFEGSAFTPSIYTYQTAEEFVNSLSVIPFDVVFMDIDLPDLDGISAAKLMRKQNVHAILVFVSNLSHLAIRGYEVNALDFILKPVIYEDFKLKLKRIENVLTKRKSKSIQVDIPGGMRLIQADEIMYVEVTNHTIVYHLVDENIPQYATLASIEDKLSDFNFIKCHRCYLVNPMYIKKMDGLILTVGNDKISVSRPKKAAFMKELNNYLNNGSNKNV